MPLPQNFQFSQSSLQDYVDCPRRFALKYKQRLRWPAPIAEPLAEHERHMRQGVQFHRMIHQHALGVPVDSVEAGIGDDQLLDWWQAYLESPFNIQSASNNDLPEKRWTEIVLSTAINGFRLLAMFDVLAIDPGGRAIIIDWKTSTRKPGRVHLSKRMQTLVYRYLLVEAGDRLNGGRPIAPEQVMMMYWFTAEPLSPEKFTYDRAVHIETGEYLHRLIDEISARETFDLTTETRHCKFCPYRSLCERGVSAGDFREIEQGDPEVEDDDFDLDFDLDQIAEVEF